MPYKRFFFCEPYDFVLFIQMVEAKMGYRQETISTLSDYADKHAVQNERSSPKRSKQIEQYTDGLPR